jgi:hypothetical protein
MQTCKLRQTGNIQIGKHAERQKFRQANMQTGKHSGKQTFRQADIKPDN